MKRLLILVTIFYSIATGTERFVGPGEAYTTISAGVTATGAGDTLTIRGKIYYNDPIVNPTSGTGLDAMTLIRADTTLAITIDMQQNATNVFALQIASRSYIEIRGINFYNAQNAGVSITSSGYIYLSQCMSGETANGNHYNISINDCVNPVLVEECVTYGRGRYGIGISGNHDPSDYDKEYVVIRRCIARLDYFRQATGEEPHGAFIAYQKGEVHFQNCIAIDGISTRYWGSTQSHTNYLFGANGVQNSSWDYCIVANCQGGIGYWESANSDSNLVQHLLVVGHDTAYGGNVSGVFGANSADAGEIQNFSLFYNNLDGGIDAASFGITARRGFSYGDTIADWVISDVTNDSLALNAGWGSYATGLRNTYSVTNGTNLFSTAAYNPSSSYTWSLYPDAGSQLETSNIGASLKYQFGTTGTFWGQAGWNTLTETPLFPFSNEDSIKAILGRYSVHNDSIPGLRGWAASSKSLGEYIAELGPFPENWVPLATPKDSVLTYINSQAWAFQNDFKISGAKAVESSLSGFKLYSKVTDSTFTELDKHYTGEPVNGLAIQNDTLYAASDSFLYRADISADTIRVIDSLQILNGRDVIVLDQNVWYLSTTMLYLKDAVTLATTQSTAITNGYSITLGNAAGDTILVSRLTSGLDFRNGSTLANIRTLQPIELGSSIRRALPVAGNDFVYIDGYRIYRYNFVADAVEDSLVLDNTNPTRWLLSNVAGDTLYPSAYIYGVMIVDVQNLDSLAAQTTTYNEYYRGTYANGYTYLGAFTHFAPGIQIKNVKNIPIKDAGLIESNDYVRGVTFVGDSIYASMGDFGVSLYDASYSDLIFRARTKRTAVWHYAGNAFWGLWGNGDAITYLSTPGLAVLDSLPSFNGYKFAFVGDSTAVGVSFYDGIIKLSIADNAISVSYSNTNPDYDGQDIYVNATNDTFYIASGTKIYSFLVSNLTVIDSIGSNCTWLSGNSSNIFGTKGADLNELIKLGPRLNYIDSLTLTDARNLYATDDYLYIARGSDGYDVYNPATLELIEHKTSTYNAYDIREQNGLVVLADGANFKFLNHTGVTPPVYVPPTPPAGPTPLNTGNATPAGTGKVTNFGNGRAY